MSHAIMYAMEDRPELLEGLVPTGPILAQMRRTDFSKVPADVREKIDIVVTTGGSGAKADLINGLPNLKIIACWGTGYEGVDLKAAAARSVKVVSGEAVHLSEASSIGPDSRGRRVSA